MTTTTKAIGYAPLAEAALSGLHIFRTPFMAVSAVRLGVFPPTNAAPRVLTMRDCFEVIRSDAASMRARWRTGSRVARVVQIGARGLRTIRLFPHPDMNQYPRRASAAFADLAVSATGDAASPEPAIVGSINADFDLVRQSQHGGDPN